MLDVFSLQLWVHVVRRPPCGELWTRHRAMPISLKQALVPVLIHHDHNGIASI